MTTEQAQAIEKGIEEAKFLFVTGHGDYKMFSAHAKERQLVVFLRNFAHSLLSTKEPETKCPACNGKGEKSSFSDGDIRKCTRCNGKGSYSTKEPETVGEWSVDFDRKFPELGVIEGVTDSGSICGYDATDVVKSFIRSLLTSKLSEQRSEMMGRLPIPKDYIPASDFMRGYELALKDVHEALGHKV